MLGAAGIPTWTYQRGSDEMRARMLPDIVATLEQINGFDTDLLKLINFLLNDLRADNLRNDIAHALVTAETFSRQYAELLLLILIRLVPYGIATSATEASAAKG